jgi:hypothetical protein
VCRVSQVYRRTGAWLERHCAAKACGRLALSSVCCVLSLVVAPGVASDKSRPQAEKMLAAAEQLADIRTPGSVPFRLKAHFLAVRGKGPAYEGTYSLEWRSVTSWKDEVKTADFEEVRLAHGDRVLISRHPSTPVLEVFRMYALVDFPVYFELNPNWKIQKLSETQDRGISQKVIDISVGETERPWIKVFLDGTRPVVNRIEKKGQLFEATYPFRDFERSWEFEDYREFHGHLFSIQVHKSRRRRPQGTD